MTVEHQNIKRMETVPTRMEYLSSKSYLFCRYQNKRLEYDINLGLTVSIIFIEKIKFFGG